MNATERDDLVRVFLDRERAGARYEASKLRATLRYIAGQGCELDPEYNDCGVCNPCVSREALESEAR